MVEAVNSLLAGAAALNKAEPDEKAPCSMQCSAAFQASRSIGVSGCSSDCLATFSYFTSQSGAVFSFAARRCVMSASTSKRTTSDVTRTCYRASRCYPVQRRPRYPQATCILLRAPPPVVEQPVNFLLDVFFLKLQFLRCLNDVLDVLVRVRYGSGVAV